MKKYIIKQNNENGEWYFAGIQFDSERDKALEIDEEGLEKAKKIFEILGLDDYIIISKDDDILQHIPTIDCNLE